MSEYEEGYEAALRSESVGISRKNRERVVELEKFINDVIARCERPAALIAMDAYDLGFDAGVQCVAAWLREFPKGDEQ